ncbi:hypothetical protein UPYG_G00053940, partial [Umbra pygmaea]
MQSLQINETEGEKVPTTTEVCRLFLHSKAVVAVVTASHIIRCLERSFRGGVADGPCQHSYCNAVWYTVSQCRLALALTLVRGLLDFRDALEDTRLC